MDMESTLVSAWGTNLAYTREELLALRTKEHAGQTHHRRRPYRGCRAGTKLKAKRMEKRWRFKPSVPSVVMGNVNALTNKTDELATLVSNQRLYRECSILCFTETWLTSNIPDANVDIPGFTTIRADRDPKRSGKNKGGGLVLFVNIRWCNPGHVTVKEIICCRDVELLAVSLRPYYMPRELSHAIVVCVYIPPRADAETACDVIHATIARLQTQHPEAFLAISGDFNNVTLDSVLPAFHQYVKCPTRKNRTIDLLYSNLKDAYSATPLPPLGKSDHNLIYLQPQYKPQVRRQPASTRSFRKWSPDAEAALRDCFESTEWSVLQEPYGEDIEGITHCMTDYMNFCMDIVVPVKTVRCFANNKPWITSNVKGLLNKKKRAFKENNQEELRSVQRELKVHLREAKESYRKKVEQKLRENDMREVWNGMKTITGCKQRMDSAADGEVERANEFNTFYNRFDCPVQDPTALVDTSSTPPLISSSNSAPAPPYSPHSAVLTTSTTVAPPPPPPLHTFTADQVRGELRRLHPRKAAGPDKVCPRLLKSCAAELGAPLQHIFNLSLHLGRVPTLWKTTCLVPVPKKTHPSELNDFRPVALTSHIMKTLERLLLHHLRPQVQHAMDPLQFAYREKVGVDDAILYFLHRTHSHLDRGGSTVRVMFFDFSSAFNTIQPLLLKDKLVGMQVDPYLVSWITDYLTDRPQYVRLKDCTSETVVCSTGAPQGTVLSPFLFTLYTSDFQYNSETCHMQKFSDDTAIVACIRGGKEEEYRHLVEDFVAWCNRNNLLLNTSKTKEMVVDFRRARPPTQPVSIVGVDVEMVKTYRYLGLHLDDRLDWSANTDILYRKGQSRLFFLRRLGSFNICRKLLLMFYQTVVSSCLFYAVVCWGGSMKKRDEMRLNKLVRRAGSVVGVELDSVVTVAERRTLHKLLSIMDDDGHPLHSIIMDHRSSFSGRFLSQSCSTDRLRRSFVPRAIRLFNSSQWSRKREDT
uniref:Reverse transcriptase domain-containing protein n=1 Tax=Astyanax mexicanus TaxID=7994 RepID=A0A3B1JI52_ASTMX